MKPKDSITMRAEKALEALRAAKTEHEIARAARQELARELGPVGHNAGHYHWTTDENRLRLFEAKRRELVAEDAAREAEIAASLAVQAAEIAERDVDAVACDGAQLLEDLDALLAEEDARRAELEAAIAKTNDRLDRARAAFQVVAARRGSAGIQPRALPSIIEPTSRPPRGVPASSPGPTWARDVRKALTEMIDAASTPRRTNVDALRALAAEEEELRADIELRHREREKAEKDADARRADERAFNARRAEEVRRQNEAVVKQKEKDDARQRELAAAHRRRELELAGARETAK